MLAAGGKSTYCYEKRLLDLRG